jgi:cardiolipin synthase
MQPGVPPPTQRASYAHAAPRMSAGNTLRLLTGGDALFPAMRDAIAQARSSVLLATYIFWHDTAAFEMADLLAATARRGVRVRVVVDGFGSRASLPALRERLAGSGVDLAVFRPLDRWYAWLQPGQMRRLHQKLCTVDGAVAFVGGINIIDDRIDLHHGSGDAPRLDFAVEVRGPLVAPIEQTAGAMWSRARFGHDWRAEIRAVLRSAEPLARVRALLQRMRIVRRDDGAPADDARAPRPVRAAFVVRDNLRRRRAIERSYIEAFRSARERIDLASPYFYPGRAFLRTLRDAARRGVRVRVLLQGKIDYRIAALAASVLYDEMLASGVRIYEYEPAFLHAKIACVDGRWCTVGSSNIDPLSLLLNLEANVVVQDDAFAADVAQAFDAALAQSREVTTPASAGWWALLRRGVVAWGAHWYLRMAGVLTRY